MTTETTIKSPKKRASDHLKPYQFKPGNNANPKGRPKSILSKKERLELLSEMAKLNKHKANPVEAIREQNRMEGVYPIEGGNTYNDIKVLIVREKPRELPQHTVEKELLDHNM